ncbi:MAG: geranylgeranyl reductase family protein [Ruminococcus sp.]|nr:geranylgeranyl reductase family protein [Ruminococcus sp.]
MKYRYDTVIIGAGPAGAACGITLRKNEKNVCIIDKATFPRHKTCAGLVADKTYQLIQTIFETKEIGDLFCDSAKEVALFAGTRPLASSEIERPVYFVDRSRFDNALVQRYKALGGILTEGEKNLKIDYARKAVLLSGGDEVHYRTLIFADGALGMSHKLTSVKKEDFAIGIEAYVPASMLSVDSVKLYFGYLDSGYIWVFPHGDRVCIGAGESFCRDHRCREALYAFLSDVGIDPADVRLIGAFIPYGTAPDQRKLSDDILLIGDAAGLTDPISGEGLYMSMRSGMFAAQALLSPDPKKTYLRSIALMQKTARDGARVRNIFYSPAFHQKIMRKINGNGRVVGFYFDHMVNHYRYTYRNIPKLYRDYKNGKKQNK